MTKVLMAKAWSLRVKAMLDPSFAHRSSRPAKGFHLFGNGVFAFQ